MSDSLSARRILRFFDVIVRTRHSFCIAIRKLRSRCPKVLCKNGGTFSGKHTWWGPPFIQVPNENLKLCQRSTPVNFKNSYLRDYLGTAASVFSEVHGSLYDASWLISKLNFFTRFSKEIQYCLGNYFSLFAQSLSNFQPRFGCLFC